MFNPKIYKEFPIDDLTIYAISNIFKNRDEFTVERLISECFTLFPEKFGLTRYRQWPDYNRIRLSLSRCKNKGWVVGNAKSGFKITKFGEDKANRVCLQLKTEEKLPEEKVKKEHYIDSRGKWESMIRYFKSNNIFHKYLKEREMLDLTENDIRSILLCTLETPIRILRQNLINALEISDQLNEREISNFLLFCAKKIGIPVAKKQIRK